MIPSTNLPRCTFLALALVAATICAAQSPISARPASYDVVSIELERPDVGENGFRYTSMGFEAYDVTLSDIVRAAYGLSDPKLVTGASGIKATFHIVAKLSPSDVDAMQSLTPAELAIERQQLLQGILKDRFHAVVHHTTSRLKIFSLEVSSGGLKLQEISTEVSSGHMVDATVSKLQSQTFFADGRIKGIFSMAQLAHILSASAKVGSDASDRSVVDDTGLKGRYIFDLAWTSASGHPPPSVTSDTEVYGSAPSALDAMGLRLVPREVDADGIVIDRATMPDIE